jgi:integrase/recombinase XerD
MQWDEAYEYWERAVRVRSRDSRTWVTYGYYLRSWGRWCDPMAADHRDVLAWLDANGSWGPSAQKSARSALVSFYRLMVAEGEVRESPMGRVPVPKQPRRLPRPADEAQVAAGLRARDADTRLMVALASMCGLRRAEIAAVRREDVVRDGLLVRGKGQRDRWVPLDRATAAELRRRPPGWVFPGRLSGHVHPATVYRRIREAAETSPHPMRHRYATVVYDASGDLLAVRDLLGHASTATTEGYVALAEHRLRTAAAAAWAPPGPRRLAS